MSLRSVGNNSIPLYIIIYSIIYTNTYSTYVYLSISFHGNRCIVNIHKNVITAFPNIINIKTLTDFFLNFKPIEGKQRRGGWVGKSFDNVTLSTSQSKLRYFARTRACYVPIRMGCVMPYDWPKHRTESYEVFNWFTVCFTVCSRECVLAGRR